MWNRHSESKTHDIHEIGSGTKLLFTFLSLKVFRHKEREKERERIFQCWLLLHLPQTTWSTPSTNYWSSLGGPQKSNFQFGRRNSTLLLFLKSPKSSTHASGARRHSHPLVSFYIWGFILTSVNDASFPHAREHLRSCLHLTNSCTEPKGSHPN